MTSSDKNEILEAIGVLGREMHQGFTDLSKRITENTRLIHIMARHLNAAIEDISELKEDAQVLKSDVSVLKKSVYHLEQKADINEARSIRIENQLYQNEGVIEKHTHDIREIKTHFKTL